MDNSANQNWKSSTQARLWAMLIVSILACSPFAIANAQSVPITGISFDTGSLERFSNGTDIWPATWAADNLIYIGGGDGDGCDGTDTRGLDIDTLSGGPHDSPEAQCTEVYSDTGVLPKGLISVDGTLYSLLSERADQNGDGISFAAAQFCSSTDNGSSWSCTDWEYEGEWSFPQGMFINFGQDNSGARDNYVYMLGMELDSGGFFDEITLARMPKNSIKNVSSHEYFSGMDANGGPTWTSTYSNRQPIHSNSDSIHWGATINYNPVLNRYLLCYFKDNNSSLLCYDGPEPWGPWTLIHDNQLVDSTEKYSLFFVNKNDGQDNWISADGKTWSFLISGMNAWDSLNFMTATLTTSGSTPPNPPENLIVE